VPGKDNTIWANGLFKVEVAFPDGTFPSHISHYYIGEREPDRYRVPNQTAKVQIRPPRFPSKRLPLWHHLPLHPRRGRSLETSYHNQGNPPGHTDSVKRAEPEQSGAGGGVYAVQEG
jgi:hypothetical protein